MVSTSTQIASFAFDNCLMNAAGVACMTKEELAEVKDFCCGNLCDQDGDTGISSGKPRTALSGCSAGVYQLHGPAQQWFGLLSWLPAGTPGQRTKSHFLPLFGRYVARRTHTILKKVQASDFKGITELNLSCPNVPGKPQIAYDFETTEKILSEVFAYFTKPLGIKLPPYFDIVHFWPGRCDFLTKYPL